MAHCRNCGTPLSPQDSFCPDCGTQKQAAGAGPGNDARSSDQQPAPGDSPNRPGQRRTDQPPRKSPPPEQRGQQPPPGGQAGGQGQQPPPGGQAGGQGQQPPPPRPPRDEYGGPQAGHQPGHNQTVVDQLAPIMSWVAVVFMGILALGTITESVSGMPVRLWLGTFVYVLLAAFAAPPVRTVLADQLDVTFSRAVVVVILIAGPLLNEGLITPPIEGGPAFTLLPILF